MDMEASDTPQLLKDNIVPPSKQQFAERSGNVNKWRASHCHCGACRRTVGALMVDWVNVPTNVIKITRNGETGRYRASNHATREFCKKCGTALFFLDDEDTEIVDVNVASITTPNVFDYIEYGGHIWLGDVKDLVLDEDKKGGGLAGILNDGLPRTVRGRQSEPF